MKKLLLALLLIPALAGAQDFKHRYFHYNQYFDAPAPFTITATTIDGADSNGLCISGGGGCGSGTETRGARLYMTGNETGAGSATLYSGNPDYGAVDIGSFGGAANGGIIFRGYLGNVTWTMKGGDFVQNTTNGGNIVQTKAGTGHLIGLAAAHADFTSAYAAPNFLSFNSATDYPTVIMRGVASTAAGNLVFAKSRSTDGTGDVKAESGDGIGTITFAAADGSAGAAFVPAATIYATVYGTSGDTDMPGRLAFTTTPDGSGTPLERWYMGPTGDLSQDSTNGGNIVMSRANTYYFHGNGNAARGADVSALESGTRATIYGGSTQLVYNYAASGGSSIDFIKSVRTDGEGDTAVAADDDLGSLVFRGADGTDFAFSAQLLVEVDGTPGSNDMPGRFVFKVAPDGSQTPAEALRITSQGTTLVKGVAVASLPASCAPGSLIRATDSNDCAAGGGDGAMCICVAAGTWALAHNY